MPGVGGSTGVPFDLKTDPRLVPTQRRLLTELHCIQDGLKGVTNAAKQDADKKSLKDVGVVTSAVVTLLLGPQPPDPKAKPLAPGKMPQPLTIESLTKDLKKKVDEFDKIAKRLAPPEVKSRDAAEEAELDTPAGTPAAAPEKAAASAPAVTRR